MDEPKFNGMTRKEVVRAWVRALESGEYKQGREYLCQVLNYEYELRYCCLGVLCEVIGVPKKTRVNIVIFGYENEENSDWLPETVSSFLGLDSASALTLLDDRYSLAEMNDDGASFEDIADVIRQGRVSGLEDAPLLLKDM